MTPDFDDRCKLKDALFLSLLEAVAQLQSGHSDVPSSRVKSSSLASTSTSTSASSSSMARAASSGAATTSGSALSLEGALHDLCVQLQDTLEQDDVDKALDNIMDQVLVKWQHESQSRVFTS